MTEIIEVEGVRYRKVAREAKKGDLVFVFDQTVGANGIFTVDKVRPDGHIFYEEFGRRPGGYYVLEPIESEHTPSLTDLLANLALRVSELERHNREQAYEINELYKAVAK